MNNNNSKIAIVLVLIICVVGISIGLAAFSNSLNIDSSATVTPTDANFKVVFSSNANSMETNNLVATKNSDEIIATNAIIDNSIKNSPSITNLSASFTNHNQKATYTFYVRNEGLYDAYLTSINYASIPGKDVFKECRAKNEENSNETLITNACTGISVSVKIGNETITSNTVSEITEHILQKNQSEEVVVTIEYAENSVVALDDFDVTFGKISLIYKSNDEYNVTP